MHIYRIPCRRTGALVGFQPERRVRAYSGTVWAIAGPDGTVLCYSLTYPSSALIEDCRYALTNA